MEADNKNFDSPQEEREKLFKQVGLTSKYVFAWPATNAEYLSFTQSIGNNCRHLIC